MPTIYKPKSADAVAELIRTALSRQAPLEIIGNGSKRAIGRPLQTEATLSTGELTGITLYEPEELVLSARAGTTMAEIDAALATHHQQLAFDPIDYSKLLASVDAPTIGGAISCNLSGPKRIRNGAARDHILGITAVSGRGELFKSGGRVVKNVTGYDLAKVMTGAYGTLGVLTDITVKVLPRSQTELTVVLYGPDLAQAIAAMAAAMGSVFDVSAAAYCPQNSAPEMALDDAAVLLHLEGFGSSIQYRAAQLQKLLGEFGRCTQLTGSKSATVWRQIKNVEPFTDHSGPVWRLSVPPSSAAAVVDDLNHDCVAAYYLDWQGGLIWLAMHDAEDAHAGAIRPLLVSSGGHATLIRATSDRRLNVPVFQPQPAPLQALSRRLKEQFDPVGILNPGKLDGG